MNFLRYLLPLALAVSFTSNAIYAYVQIEKPGNEQSSFEETLNERDWESLKDFLNSKRTLDLADKSCNLSISGDVRSEWRHLTEKRCHDDIRGGNAVDFAGFPISRNDFDIEANLRFDYICDRAWAVAHLQFDNSAGVDDTGHPCCNTEFSETPAAFCAANGHTYHKFGILAPDPRGWHGSGSCDDICLKKAYFGYNVCCEADVRFDVEVGRRNLYNVFDSKVQFLSRFDGILLKYQNSLECLADMYINLAGFVVDERVNHFAYATEIGFLNICDYNFDFKYSFIDWKKRGKNRCFVHNPAGFKFMNSQFTFAYRFDSECLCLPAKVYGAFLVNHHAHKDRQTRHQRENWAWYIGLTLGQVCHEGDFSIDLQYQYVQALAIPEYDVSGIGRGNVLNETLTSSGRGNTNYQGVRFEALYALTDNLTLDTIVEYSRDIKDSIGGRHTYSKFELEAIYAF